LRWPGGRRAALATLLLSGLTGILAWVWWRYGENHAVSAATALAAVLTLPVPVLPLAPGELLPLRPPAGRRQDPDPHPQSPSIHPIDGLQSALDEYEGQ
jgi:hypothetical protein